MDTVRDYSRRRESYQKRIEKIHSEEILEAKEEGSIHDTYRFEQLMLSYIRDGETEKLKELFGNVSRIQEFTVGVLAEAPLRQEKNILIGLVAVVGKTAAIPGGMEVEEVYRLIDIYTQECEKAGSVEEISMLRFNMIMDFTERVRKRKHPGNMSPEVFEAIQYIDAHSHEKISLDDVARETAYSRSHITRLFRKETGQTVNEYITGVKIRDAQRFLLYTNRTFSEIANILNFSSQSYFQTVFKKTTGMTPREYRNSQRL